MIRSMTGYGEAEIEVDEFRVRAEVRTVNHRFLNTSIRLPPGHDRLEAAVLATLKAHFTRGHLTVSVSHERLDAARDPLPEADLDRARHALTLYRTLGSELGIIGEVDVATIARFPDVVRIPDRRGEQRELPAEVVERVVEAATLETVAFREAEGARLQSDLEERLDALDEALDAVEARAPERLVAERDRLRGRIAELIEADEVDDDRLAREVAWLAEKWDINEEIVRFRGHIALMRDTLAGEGEGGVGKRLSFIVQEMHREANTIGSKANDTTISHAAVGMKEEVERLREQVENVE
ncbi:MAG: YicC/YloC family endoribonuclease [Longimicrobiales bacterium]|nr:YicC/YloC family endoribonuclease [Longimicrobiales bacterium]